MLEESFGNKKTISFLQLQLNSCKQNRDEDVRSYSLRLEELQYKLISASCGNKSETERKTIAEYIKSLPLTIFLEGLNESIKNIVKSRKNDSLAETVQNVIEEERTTSFKTSTRNLNFSSNFDKSCHFCGKKEHISRDCRNRNRSFSQWSSNNSKNNHSNNRVPPLQTSRNILICNYCKKPGHHINDCLKRKNNMNRQRENSNGQHGFNDNTQSNQNNATNIKSRIMYFKNLNDDHLEINFSSFERSCHFLVDSGADLNIIKINVVENETIIIENKVTLMDIGVTPVETLGYIEVLVDDRPEKIVFHVVAPSFPIPRDGIVGKQFLKENDLNINLKRQVIFDSENLDSIIHDKESKREPEIIQPFVLPPRCEKICEVENDRPDGDYVINSSKFDNSV
jgi:hypothetical protein